jgi:ribosomal protein S18 acetylase RimI-like enzyme
MPPAELLSIMVEPEQRSAGVGALLVTALLAECERRGLAALDVTVDAANAGAQRFYVRHGFVYADTFMLYGRTMHRYQAHLSPASARVDA